MNNPFVFVVGCQRSGTTLLQHMLDSHPELAVMQENGWFGTWYELGTGITESGCATRDLVPHILRTCKNADLGLTEAMLCELIGAGSTQYSDFISALFDRCGALRGKTRVGSKNPDYLRHLDTLHTLWPNARFVHIIRDGRDICASMSSRWKKNGVFRGFPFLLYEAPDKVFDAWTEDPTVTTALWWEWNVSLGQRFGRKLGSEMYYEMRYERLVEHPEAECRDLCHFLGLRFEDSMLRHHENFKPRRGPNGNILHASVGLPVTRGLRDWRSELRTDDISLFEAAAASFLDQLGYECVTQPDAKCLDQARRVRSTFQDRATLALNRDRAVAVVA